MANRHLEKVYLVEFMRYTNPLKDAVSDSEHKNYITLGKEPFLIRESDFAYYGKFGGGFRIIKFVGNIEI